MSVCVTVRVRVCEWRGEFNRVVLVVQLGLIFHFILNPEQRRVFQLVSYKRKDLLNIVCLFPRTRRGKRLAALNVPRNLGNEYTGTTVVSIPVGYVTVRDFLDFSPAAVSKYCSALSVCCYSLFHHFHFTNMKHDV
jgi:hypothetical protein